MEHEEKRKKKDHEGLSVQGRRQEEQPEGEKLQNSQVSTQRLRSEL